MSNSSVLVAHFFQKIWLVFQLCILSLYFKRDLSDDIIGVFSHKDYCMDAWSFCSSFMLRACITQVRLWFSQLLVERFAVLWWWCTSFLFDDPYQQIQAVLVANTLHKEKTYFDEGNVSSSVFFSFSFFFSSCFDCCSHRSFSPTFPILCGFCLWELV